MRFSLKISENREIEDIIADKLYILIGHIMMDIKRKGGGAYKPVTRASSASCFSHEILLQYHPQPTASGSTQDLGHCFFHLVSK